MFRQVWTVALVVLTAFGGLACTTTPEAKEEGGKTETPPQELTLDLGKGVKLEMVLIPAGEFIMGRDDAERRLKLAHKVRITKPFYLGKCEVTQEQWEAMMSGNPSKFKGPKNPVEAVSWDDCQKFLEKLNALVGAQDGKFVLPSEAQWEYACRAGSDTMYCFGDDESQLGEYAWYDKNSEKKPHPVGQKKPNAFGLYDMHGNVNEWCHDRYDGRHYYANSPTDDPLGSETGRSRVRRGGAWNYPAGACASRSGAAFLPSETIHSVGLRVCRVSAEAAARYDPQPAPEPPPRVEGQIVFRAGWAPARAPGFGSGFGQCQTYLGSVSPNKDGVLEAFGVQAWMIPRGTLWVIVDYPRLRMDDIVPVFGQLSRVTEIYDRGRPKGSEGKDWMVMLKADEKNLPPGLTFNDRCVVVPLSRDGLGSTGFNLNNTRMLLTKIEPATADDKRGPVAEIKLFDHAKTPSETVLKLRRDDMLTIRNNSFRVLNVIPRDEKTHVIGWIELAP